jgi:hypothetical protein
MFLQKGVLLFAGKNCICSAPVVPEIKFTFLNHFMGIYDNF